MASSNSALTNDTCVKIQEWANSPTQRKFLVKQESTIDMVSVGSVNKLLGNLSSPERDRLLEWIGTDKVTKERAKLWTNSLMSKEVLLLFSYTDIIDMSYMLHFDAFQNKRKIIVVLKEIAYFRTFQMMAKKIRIDTNDFVVRELQILILKFLFLLNYLFFFK
jgi:hypothetical protein